MIPENVVFVAFSFPPNRRFYKEIISVSREIVLRGIKRYWRAQERSDGDDYKDEKIDKKNRFNKQNKNTQCLHRTKNVVKH